MVAGGSARLRRRPVGRGCQLQLEPADVVPGALLEADLAVDPGALEAERFVQAEARLVRQGDAGAGHAEAALAQALEERLVEGAADALTAGVRGDVDGDAGAPAVGRALVEGGRVGVADDLSPALGDEPGVAAAIALDPRRQRGCVRGPFLEGDGTALDVRRVDRGAGGCVA